MELYTKHTKEKLKLSDKPFASGGEGSLYKISSPHSLKNLVVKIYHSNKRSTEQEEKLNYLIAHPPILSEENSLAWPVDLVYGQEGFMGFMMPLLKGKTLTVLTLNLLSDKIGPQWNRFELGNQNAHKLRKRICLHLAKTIHELHDTKRYVIVDLKPDNIVVRPNGSAALIDMDSIEVLDNKKILYPAYSATPEYSPPEYHQLQKERKEAIDLSWNRFSMSIIFYQLLLGIHPFAGSCKAPFQKMVSLSDKIKAGLFVHGGLFQKHFLTIPPPHQGFEELNYELKEFFKLCFENGHHVLQMRPTAQEWVSVLTAVLDQSSDNAFFHINKKTGQAPSTQINKKSLTTSTVGVQTSKIDQQVKVIKPLMTKTQNIEFYLCNLEFKSRLKSTRIITGIVGSLALTLSIALTVLNGFSVFNLLFWMINIGVPILTTAAILWAEKQRLVSLATEKKPKTPSIREELRTDPFTRSSTFRQIKTVRAKLNQQFRQLKKQKEQAARLLPLQQAVANTQKELLQDLKRLDQEYLELAEKEYQTHLKTRQKYLDYIQNNPFLKNLGILSYVLLQSRGKRKEKVLKSLQGIHENIKKSHLKVEKNYAQQRTLLQQEIKNKLQELKKLKKELASRKTLFSSNIKKQEQFDYNLQDNYKQLEKAYEDAQKTFKLKDYLKQKKPISISQYLLAFWGRKTSLAILKDLKEK
ncbi:MAG: hypothetical protein GY810_32690 [Aureispira sp.]|nr:hypothetical protein [Aureispira sp.]